MKLASTLFLAVTAQRVKDSSEKRKNDKERKLDEHKENKTFDDDFWWIPNNGAVCTKKMKDWFSMTGQGGMSGTIKVENYPDGKSCYEPIIADPSCQAIRVTFKSVAVEACGANSCWCDQFRFSWLPEGKTEDSDQEFSEANCNCVGDGCDSVIHDLGQNYNAADLAYYDTMAENQDYYESQGSNYYNEGLISSDGITFNTNKFKFIFNSDNSWGGGHVDLEWECVQETETTMAPWETTMTTTTGSTTTSGTTTTAGTTQAPTTIDYSAMGWDTECDVREVFTEEVCNDDGTDYKNDEMRHKYPRLATVAEAQAEMKWQPGFGLWWIGSLYKGQVLGKAYEFGAQLPIFEHIQGTSSAWTVPPCKKYNVHLMCLNPEPYDAPATQPPTTSCPYNDYNGFAAALKEGIKTSLQNDIMKWSRKQPEKVTPGAQLRVDQFTNWMSSIVELWRYSVVNDTRKCLRKNFPEDNPALLSKDVIGDNCALDMVDLRTLCDKLSSFFDFAYQGCDTNPRKRKLSQRCGEMFRFSHYIEKNWDIHWGLRDPQTSHPSIFPDGHPMNKN